MSCPDWRHLDPDGESASWEAALRHLDGGCRKCWQDAVAADPTLIFKRLPAAPIAPAEEADEVAATRLAVAAMRTASRSNHGRVSARVALPALATWRDRHSLQGAKRWALAAGLAATALLVGSDHGWRPAALHGVPPVVAAALPAAGGGLAPVSSSGAAGTLVRPTAGGWQPTAMPAADRSSIEGLSRPGARVYQIDGPQMSVVMIVDDKLDV